MEDVYILLTVLIPWLSLVIGAVWLIKSDWIDNKIQQVLTDFAETAVNDPEVQKNLYIIGGIVAKGAKDGFGLKSSGGKLRFQDILMQLVAGYAGNMMQGQAPQSTNNSSLPNILGVNPNG